ncbi:MAG: hypothetical protein ACAH59_02655 [Pseudobdellovibrionaceae bacterium]
MKQIFTLLSILLLAFSTFASGSKISSQDAQNVLLEQFELGTQISAENCILVVRMEGPQLVFELQRPYEFPFSFAFEKKHANAPFYLVTAGNSMGLTQELPKVQTYLQLSRTSTGNEVEMIETMGNETRQIRCFFTAR